jgi:hypothetical protein
VYARKSKTKTKRSLNQSIIKIHNARTAERPHERARRNASIQRPTTTNRLTEGGQTAAGPALLVALGIAQQARSIGSIWSMGSID